MPFAARCAANAPGVGEGMAAGALVGGQVGVEVEVDGARDVARVVRGAAGAGLAEVPAAVDDAESRVVQLGGEFFGRDQR